MVLQIVYVSGGLLWNFLQQIEGKIEAGDTHLD